MGSRFSNLHSLKDSVVKRFCEKVMSEFRDYNHANHFYHDNRKMYIINSMKASILRNNGKHKDAEDFQNLADQHSSNMEDARLAIANKEYKKD